MTKIALLTRKPDGEKNNWVFVAQQDDNPYLIAPVRLTIWGRGRNYVRGVSAVEAENTFEEYIEKRKNNGYVKQICMNINIPTSTIIKGIKWIGKIILRYIDDREGTSVEDLLEDID